MKEIYWATENSASLAMVAPKIIADIISADIDSNKSAA